MNKLIKLSEKHYVIVNDSEIKEGDWDIEYCDIDKKWLKPEQVFNKDWDRVSKANYCRELGTNFKITHSTEPLEHIADKYKDGVKVEEIKRFDKIKPLSLSEVEEAIYGYSVEKMAEQYVDSRFTVNPDTIFTFERLHRETFEAGFKAHKKITKDKLFTKNDLLKALVINSAVTNTLPPSEIIKSLIQKEWNIKFNEQDKLELV